MERERERERERKRERERERFREAEPLFAQLLLCSVCCIADVSLVCPKDWAPVSSPELQRQTCQPQGGLGMPCITLECIISSCHPTS